MPIHRFHRKHITNYLITVPINSPLFHSTSTGTQYPTSNRYSAKFFQYPPEAFCKLSFAVYLESDMKYALGRVKAHNVLISRLLRPATIQ